MRGVKLTPKMLTISCAIKPDLTFLSLETKTTKLRLFFLLLLNYQVKTLYSW